jgi:Zn-dependent protease with chaperone function
VERAADLIGFQVVGGDDPKTLAIRLMRVHSGEPVSG